MIERDRSKQLIAAALCGLWAAGGSGCAAADRETSWEGTIEVRDGVTYVSSPQEPLWSGGPDEPVRFELEQVFGTDAGARDAILGEPNRISAAVDDGGNVYVLDGQTNRVVGFSPDGGIRWVAGGEGQGPGEIDTGFGIAVDDAAGLVAIDNQTRSRIDFWDTDGAFVRSASLQAPPLGRRTVRFATLIGLAEPGVAVLGGGLFGAFGSVGYVVGTEPPELVARCEMNENPEIEISSGLSAAPDVRFQDGMFLFGSSYGFTLRTFDTECTPLRVVTRPTEYPVTPAFWQQEGRAGIASFGEVNAPLILAEGRWLVSANWVEDIEDPVVVALARSEAFRAGERPEPLEYRVSLTLFDADGRFLWTRTEEGRFRPSIGRPAAVGADGRLYTIADEPFPQVRRYRVEVDADR